MDTEQLLEVGERGIHLLFDVETITEAFEQDADELRAALAGQIEDVRIAIQRLTDISDALEGRGFIERLDAPIRHILVLLYFELLDGRLRERRNLQ